MNNKREPRVDVDDIDDHDFYVTDYIWIEYLSNNQLYKLKIRYHVTKGFLPITPEDHYIGKNNNLIKIMNDHKHADIPIYKDGRWVAQHIKVKYLNDIFNMCKEYNVPFYSIEYIYKTRTVLPRGEPALPRLSLGSEPSQHPLPPPQKIEKILSWPPIMTESRHMRIIHDIFQYFSPTTSPWHSPLVSPRESPPASPRL
jgi:hypothetical protein